MSKLELNSLSVFFPCFNEDSNIPIFVQRTADFLPKICKKYEIIIVNDGSSDETINIVKDLQKQYPNLKLINHQKNLGYGAALKTGFKHCIYDWIFFTDGDLQFDITQLEKFIAYTNDYNVIIGYRTNRADGALRSLNAKIFKIYIDLLFRVHVKDIDCAFKLLKAETIKSIDLVSNGAFTTSEFLYKLKKKGERFKQLPVQHHPRLYGNPTGAKLKVIIKGVFEALKLYLQIKFKL